MRLRHTRGLGLRTPGSWHTNGIRMQSWCIVWTKVLHLFVNQTEALVERISQNKWSNFTYFQIVCQPCFGLFIILLFLIHFYPFWWLVNSKCWFIITRDISRSNGYFVKFHNNHQLFSLNSVCTRLRPMSNRKLNCFVYTLPHFSSSILSYAFFYCRSPMFFVCPSYFIVSKLFFNNTVVQQEGKSTKILRISKKSVVQVSKLVANAF